MYSESSDSTVCSGGQQGKQALDHNTNRGSSLPCLLRLTFLLHVSAIYHRIVNSYFSSAPPPSPELPPPILLIGTAITYSPSAGEPALTLAEPAANVTRDCCCCCCCPLCMAALAARIAAKRSIFKALEPRALRVQFRQFIQWL
jgi:hypothetical protein